MRGSRIPKVFCLGVSASLLMLVSGCGLFQSGPSPEETASKFLDSFAAGNNQLAAQQTDNPAAAKAMLDATRKGMHPVSLTTDLGDIDTKSNQAKAPFGVDWEFGGGHRWKYRSGLTMQWGKDAGGNERWLVHWTPSVVHPKLTGKQTLQRHEQQAKPAPVLDRDGRPLMQPERLVQVKLNKQAAGDLSSTAAALARPLGRIDHRITQHSIAQGARKTAPGQAYQVVTLRDSDYQQVKDQIHGLPGVTFGETTKLIAPEKNFGSQVLPGVRKQEQKALAAGAGWQVSAMGPGGHRGPAFTGDPPKPVQPVKTTLSRQVQQAAEDALRPVPQPAMIVALQPSSGDVLAVGQNQAANAKGSLALTGQYPPGSTFKIITAAAGLANGRIHNGDQPMECPAVKTFNGQPLPNENNFDLGTVPERVAFAKSCNTTHGQIAADLPGNALTKQARQFGIGADYKVPGITTVTGKVPRGRGALEKANEGIGQAKVQASPFGMALAAATVAHGSTPTPKLIDGQQTKSNTPPRPIPQHVLDQLRPMMRQVVTSGTGSSLNDVGEVYGKTGTAQFGPGGSKAHGWFVGYRGDMAFAVLQTDSGNNKPALNVAHQFLQNAPRM